MADISPIERMKLEKFLKMGNGYVLDMSNRSLQEVVIHSTEIDILSEKYNLGSGSKANRLRSFWDQESNYTVGKLIAELLGYWKGRKEITESEITPEELEQHTECTRISNRLKQEGPIEHIDAIQANSSDKDFSLLAKLIRESIERNEPEPALDRLHTFTVKYIRELCKKHSIAFDVSESLNAVFGKYVKFLVASKLVESTMAEKILKFSINVLEAFNDVRNNRSFAHDNPLLNYQESILIFNNISSAIKFIQHIELQTGTPEKEAQIEWNEFKV